MFRYFIAGLVAVSMFSSTLCSAAVKATPQLTQALMDKSGITRQVEQLPMVVLLGMEQTIQQSQQPIPPEVLENMKQAVLSSFRADTILKKIQQHIDKNLSKYDVDAILHWLTSPLGERITVLEVAASTTSAYETMESMKEELLQDAARVKKIRKLDAALKASETSVDLALNTQIAVASSMAAVLAPNDPSVSDQIVKAAKAGRPQMAAAMKEKTLVSLLYTYRTLKDGEIDEYIDFLTSDLGRRYQQVMTDGVNNGVVSASREMGKTFAQTLR